MNSCHSTSTACEGMATNWRLRRQAGRTAADPVRPARHPGAQLRVGLAQFALQKRGRGFADVALTRRVGLLDAQRCHGHGGDEIKDPVPLGRHRPLPPRQSQYPAHDGGKHGQLAPAQQRDFGFVIDPPLLLFCWDRFNACFMFYDEMVTVIWRSCIWWQRTVATEAHRAVPALATARFWLVARFF